jgi:hypothetical protein
MASRKGNVRRKRAGELAGPSALREALKELQRIPGVGPSIARDLLDMGVRAVSDLRDRDPDILYAAHCDRKGLRVDRCWLYVARCAVYFASHRRHEPRKLLWWNWKDVRSKTS